jgi:Flp pilus assembly protein TadG
MKTSRAKRMDRRGVVAIITAIVLPVFLLLAAMGLDLSRGYIVKQRLQTGADAMGSLVAAQMRTRGPNTLPDAACARSERLFAANFNTKTLFHAVPAPPLCVYDATRQQIIITTSASVPLIFGQLLHRDTLTLVARAYVPLAAAQPDTLQGG